jgi:hypothetical protein
VPVTSCLLWAVLCVGTAASTVLLSDLATVMHASLPHSVTIRFQPRTVFILASSKSNCIAKTMKPIVCMCAVTARSLHRLIWIKFSSVCVDLLPHCRISCYGTAFLLQTKLYHLHLLVMMSSTSLNKHLYSGFSDLLLQCCAAPNCVAWYVSTVWRLEMFRLHTRRHRQRRSCLAGVALLVNLWPGDRRVSTIKVWRLFVQYVGGICGRRQAMITLESG